MSVSNEYVTLSFTHLSNAAYTPINNAIGFDLCSPYHHIILAHGSKLIRTDLSMNLPTGNCGIIISRNSLSLKHSIIIQDNIINNNFEGNISVLLSNLSPKPFYVRPGKKICRLVIGKIPPRTSKSIQVQEMQCVEWATLEMLTSNVLGPYCCSFLKSILSILAYKLNKNISIIGFGLQPTTKTIPFPVMS